jgi:hypothetical protein
MENLLASNIQNKSSRKDIPVLSIPDMCTGCLSGAPGDVTNKHCRQTKRGTSHINIKPFLSQKPGQ